MYYVSVIKINKKERLIKMIKIEKTLVNDKMELTTLEEVRQEEKYFLENGSREDWQDFLDQYRLNKFSVKAAEYLFKKIPSDLKGIIRVADNFEEPTQEEIDNYNEYCQIVNNVFWG